MRECASVRKQFRIKMTSAKAQDNGLPVRIVKFFVPVFTQVIRIGVI